MEVGLTVFVSISGIIKITVQLITTTNVLSANIINNVRRVEVNLENMVDT